MREVDRSRLGHAPQDRRGFTVEFLPRRLDQILVDGLSRQRMTKAIATSNAVLGFHELLLNESVKRGLDRCLVLSADCDQGGVSE
jgi:hypothetical protein